MEGKLVSRDDALWVLYETTEDAEPKLHHLWWKVESIAGTGYERPEDGDDVKYRGDGYWTVTRPDNHRHCGTVHTGSGSTKAHRRVVTSVSCPQTRGKETRWNQGRWEKLLKRGWVPA